MTSKELRELALAGIDHQIEQLTAARASILNGRKKGRPAKNGEPPEPRKKRHVSKAQREAMSVNMKARWAKLRKLSAKA